MTYINFGLTKNTTYSDYVCALRYAVNFLNYQLVPFILPDTLTTNFTQFDDFSIGQFHEHCSLAVSVHGNGMWNSTSQRRFETPKNLLIWFYVVKRNSDLHFVENSFFVSSANLVSEV
jgi:hypothetical protein